MSPEQESRAIRCCGILRRQFFPPLGTTKIVIDDESYFYLKADRMPGNDGFYTSDVESAPSTVKYKCQEKFPMKIMVWIAISESGISSPFVCPRRCAIDGDIYREKCIRKRLVPFLHTHHADGDYFFWPDLATAHYANDTVRWYNELGIKFIPKNVNPPNVPQLRPIEDFWGVLKQLVYANGWEANSENQLIRRIKRKLLDIGEDTRQSLFLKVKSNIRKVAEKGVHSVQH